MDIIVAVVILGLSVEGLVVCPFFAFGLTLSDKIAGLNFLLGRLVGITCFGVIVTLIGNSVQIDNKLTNFIFGISITALGLYRIIIVNTSCDVLKKSPGKNVYAPGPSFGGGVGDGDRKRRPRRVSCGGGGKTENRVGFALGLSRGLLVPGRKFVYLAPLLLGAGALKGLAISFLYGISSSVYLAIGFMSAGLINTLMPRKNLIGTMGGIILIALGGFYAWKSKGLIH